MSNDDECSVCGTWAEEVYECQDCLKEFCLSCGRSDIEGNIIPDYEPDTGYYICGRCI